MKNIKGNLKAKLMNQKGVSLILVILAMTIMSILMIPLTRWWVNLNGNLNMSEQRIAMQGIAMNQLGYLSQESYEDLIDYFTDGVFPNQGTASNLSEVMNSKTEDGYYTGSSGTDRYVWKLEKIEDVRVVTQYTYGQANESISASGTASGGGYFMENGACKYKSSVSYSNVTNQPNPCMLVTVSVSDGTNRDYSQSFYKRSNLLRTWRYVVNRNHTDRQVLGLKNIPSVSTPFGTSTSPSFAIEVDGTYHPLYTKAQVDELLTHYYTKEESDERYYTKEQSDARYYTKEQTYNKQEVDALLAQLKADMEAKVDSAKSEMDAKVDSAKSDMEEKLNNNNYGKKGPVIGITTTSSAVSYEYDLNVQYADGSVHHLILHSGGDSGGHY